MGRFNVTHSDSYEYVIDVTPGFVPSLGQTLSGSPSGLPRDLNRIGLKFVPLHRTNLLTYVVGLDMI